MTVARPVARHTIEAAGYAATVDTRGATLCSLTFGGRDLILAFGDEEERPAMSGALLAPWPNRLAGGRYRFGAADLAVEVNEPGRDNALHGWVADHQFAVVEERPDRLVLAAVISPREGYPWEIEMAVTFEVNDDGLTHTVTVRNASARPAPFGLGVHPYVVASGPEGQAVGGWTLEIPAERVQLVSPDRLLPERIVPLSDPAWASLDFREARAVGERRVNHAYTELRRGADGWVRARVTDSSGRGVELSLDAAYRWLHVYTADELPGPHARAALAIEPMTCPPDAFNSTTDLWVLEPGASATARFGLARLGT